MRTVPISPDTALALRTWSGASDAAPIVLLHGVGGTLASWDDVGPAVAAATGRTVYAYDARGHGASSWPGAYSFELMRDDLLGLVAALEVSGPVDVVGHSMGGVVGLLFAAAHSECVRRLVLEETPPPWPRPDVTVGPRPAGDLDYDWAVIPAIRERVRTSDPSWPGLLPSIRVPTLVLAGGATSQIPQNRIADMAGLLPDARLVMIDAGHSIHQAAPERFIAEVVAFLG
jgi:pimeloyl-ACP methyl ester carboxylesterase